MNLEIKTKGLKMPNGDIHVFIPPSPAETERGGIKAKDRTTESLEIVVDPSTGKAYAPTPDTDSTLTEKGVAADSEAVGNEFDKTKESIEAISNTKADAIIETATGEVIRTEISSDLKLVDLKLFGKSEQVQTTVAQLFDDRMVVDGFILENGVLAPQTNNILNEKTSDYIILPKATRLHVSAMGIPNKGSLLWVGVCFYREDKSFIKRMVVVGSYDATTAKNTLEVPSDAVYIRVSYRKFIDVILMLNVGDLLLPYEPYTGGKPSPSPEYPQEIVTAGESGTIDLEITGENTGPQTLTVSTPNGLPGIKVDKDGNYTDSTGQQWICDRIVEKDGVIGIERNVSYKQFDGTEILSDYVGNNTSLMYNTKSVLNYTNGLCEIGKCIYPVTGSEQEEFSFSLGDDGIYIYTKKNSLELQQVLSKMKADGKPLTIYFSTKEQTFEPLPQAEQEKIKALHTNYPTTTITNDENADMEVSYVADTKLYIDKKFAELSQTILATQKALL